ncbi:MAG: FAD-binding oxidoreductase [Deltaproteobacteria bacterium]|nr:FAD-binding oxidoreductase [Deltaproteobacteria bacterium]
MILQNWWYTTLMGIKDPIQPPLKGDIKTDVLVVGGGAAGLAAAMALREKGRRVVLLERNIVGGSSTGKSAGFLTQDSELELLQLMRRFGVEGAKALWEAPTQGIEAMVSTIRKYGISCDLRKQDSLFLGNNRSGWKDVQEEAEARKLLGFPYALYDSRKLPTVLGSINYAGGVRYPGTYAINPLLYAQGVKRVLIDQGVEIHEASEVTGIKDHTAFTHLGSVTADEIIFCSDKLKCSVTRYCLNTYHAQTFLAISEPLEDKDIASFFPEEPFQCWDSDLVYTYYRLTGDGRLLVGGGSALTTFSKKDVTTPRVINGVIKRFKRKFPFLEHVEFIQYWPGRIDTTRDLLPTVLRDEKSPWVHYVLGCVGLPWATFCGNFAAIHVTGHENCDDMDYYRYFSIDRGFLIPLWAAKIVGKQAVFSLNNAWSKYYQKDQQETLPDDLRI